MSKAKMSYKDMAMKPVEFPNLRDLNTNMERLKKENAELKVEVARLKAEIQEVKGVNYDRINRVKNLDVFGSTKPSGSMRPLGKGRYVSWGDEESDPEVCDFTDDPSAW